jgi:hypothetical protein
MPLFAADKPTTQPVAAVPLQMTHGELIPSEDSVIVDFHSLGMVNGTMNLFRSACPVRDLASADKLPQPGDEAFATAKARMQHLYDLGIRTDVSLMSSYDGEKKNEANAIALEKAACEAVGIKFISDPMTSTGQGSLQTMTDQEVMAKIQPIVDEMFTDSHGGGVLFHCAAGHDRTGIVAGYIRIKYQQWSADAAIAEMRRLGHNWPKFSNDGGVTSWHEQHLRGIATMLAPVSVAK